MENDIDILVRADYSKALFVPDMILTKNGKALSPVNLVIEQKHVVGLMFSNLEAGEYRLSV